MNFHSFVLNLRTFLFKGKIQGFELISNHIIFHTEMRAKTLRLVQRFVDAPATRRGNGQASESLFSVSN